ncbi:MAG: exonuclease domain-containing protein [Lachnospiraceae bacterium]|nr:exonuclease domain-containing protein [Lachnospiraceae bacterium]
MKHIFVDLEMHPISREYQEERKVCPGEIIEFGAVMLDEELKEIASFKEYVRPEYVKEVHKKIEILTGIPQGRLSGASRFNDVFSQFVLWCKSRGDEFTIYAWSGSDLEQITREMSLKNTYRSVEVEAVLNNWVDFQKDYCELVKADKLISLEKALNSIGQYFMGDMHDALCDARNTAELFIITRNQDEFFELLSTVKNLTNDEEKTSGCTLGDLINFDSICLV